jgi:hypothetical protein
MSQVLPGKELIITKPADWVDYVDPVTGEPTGEGIYSRSLQGLDQDLFGRLEDIKRRTEIATRSSPLQQAYDQAQLYSDIQRDRYMAMPRSTAQEDVWEFMDPSYSDIDFAQSRANAKASWIDAATIANAAKRAAYGDAGDFVVPTDAYEIDDYRIPEWSVLPDGLKGIPQIGSDEYNAIGVPPVTVDPIGTDPVEGETVLDFLSRFTGGGKNQGGSLGGKITAGLGDFTGSRTSNDNINRRYAPDANVNDYINKNIFDRLGIPGVGNYLSSRFKATQGKFMPSNPSFKGVGASTTANPNRHGTGGSSINNTGGPSIGSQVGSSLGGHLGGGGNSSGSRRSGQGGRGRGGSSGGGGSSSGGGGSSSGGGGSSSGGGGSSSGGSRSGSRRSGQGGRGRR